VALAVCSKHPGLSWHGNMILQEELQLQLQATRQD